MRKKAAFLREFTLVSKYNDSCLKAEGPKKQNYHQKKTIKDNKQSSILSLMIKHEN